MRVRTLNKCTPRQARIIYEENESAIIDKVVAVTLPSTNTTTLPYNSTSPVDYVTTVPTCKSGASSTTKRYYYILAYIKNNKIGYKYYTGHKLGWQSVISYKYGNCCDLSRLVAALAKKTGLPSKYGIPVNVRYVKATIKKGDSVFNHVWPELYVNSAWVALDPTNYLLGGHPQDPYGTVTKYLSKIKYPTNPC